MSEKRELTLGEQRVGFSFNPSQNPKVLAIKSLYAGIIDSLEEDRKDGGKEKQRTISRAQTFAEDACMLTVKSIFQ